MRFPERSARRWSGLAYVLELLALMIYYLGWVLFGCITLFQLRGFLESGHWPWMALRIVFIEHLKIAILTDPSGWYSNPEQLKGLQTVAWFILERVPVSLLFLVICRYVSFILLWVVDRFMPERVVEQSSITPAEAKMRVNMK